jgi:putative transposase
LSQKRPTDPVANKLFRYYFFVPNEEGMHSIFKKYILQNIHDHEATRVKRRPCTLDPSEAVDCLFRLVRTGMQWREVRAKSASHTAVFKHTRRWIQEGLIQASYAEVLREYNRTRPPLHYIVDSTYVKNAYGRVGLGRNPVDRARKALKVSALTDQNGVIHNLRADPANTSDFNLFTPMLSSMLIELRRIEVFADRGYDSRRNRADAYSRGFMPRIMRRRCRNARRQNGKRVRVEHTFAWIDKYRRLIFQYEHTQDVHLAYTLLAMGHLLCGRLCSTKGG